MNIAVLIIDDEEKLRKLLGRILSLEGYSVTEAGSLSEARARLKAGDIQIVLCDVRLPDGNGVEFVREVKTEHPYLEVILLTAFGNIADGVQAIKHGAFDYLVKGDDNDKIIPLLSQAADAVRCKRQATPGKAPDLHGFARVIGGSRAIREAVDLARTVAPTEATVLLSGETGTGKEVFARAIHEASARSQGPFVALNCSSLSKELMESTLFGHKSGAFTGAVKDQKGLVEEAGGGTLFLDEMGELPADLQPKLLRMLEDGSFYAVGDPKVKKANVRFIAATNRNLQERIEAGQFRPDLYYRISTFKIELPALRERAADIPLLAMQFLEEYARMNGKNIRGIEEEAMEALSAFEWKGNIRELKHALERAVILEGKTTLHLDSLPPEVRNPNATLSSQDLASVERAHICKTLAATCGNKAEAARVLNIGIATLYRKIEEYGLKEQLRK